MSDVEGAVKLAEKVIAHKGALEYYPVCQRELAAALLAVVLQRDGQAASEQAAVANVNHWKARAEAAEAKLLTLVDSSSKLVEAQSQLTQARADNEVKDEALKTILNYLHHRTDDLVGDDLIGDGRLTSSFNQKVAIIGRALTPGAGSALLERVGKAEKLARAVREWAENEGYTISDKGGHYLAQELAAWEAG